MPNAKEGVKDFPSETFPIHVYLHTVGPGSPEELVPLQSGGLRHVLGVDQVLRVKDGEISQLLGEIPGSSLQCKHSITRQ